MPIARVLEMTESPLRKPSNKPRIAWTSRSWMTWMQTLSQMPFEHLLLADFFTSPRVPCPKRHIAPRKFLVDWCLHVMLRTRWCFLIPPPWHLSQIVHLIFGYLVTFCHRKVTICFRWESPLVSSPRRDSAVGSVPCIPKRESPLGNGRMEYACDMWAYWWYVKLLVRGYLWNGRANFKYPHWIMITILCCI